MLKRAVTLVAGATIAWLAFASPALAETTGTQHFTYVLRFSGDESTCTAIATGPITGVGTCEPEDVGEDQTIVHTFLPGGSFDVIPTTVNETDTFNDQACVFRFTSTETFVVRGVSGSYASATGSGTDNVTGVFRADRAPDGGCSEEGGSGVIVARATGTVTV